MNTVNNIRKRVITIDNKAIKYKTRPSVAIAVNKNGRPYYIRGAEKSMEMFRITDNVKAVRYEFSRKGSMGCR